MRERIIQYQKEIEKILRKQKDANAKFDEQIKKLKKKIADEEANENRMIADAVRKVYGEVTEETLEKFLKEMVSAKEKNEAAADVGAAVMPAASESERWD